MIIEFGDVADSQLAGAPHNRSKVGERILCCFRRVLRHFIVQASVNLGDSFTQHIADDVGVNVQGGGRRRMPAWQREP